MDQYDKLSPTYRAHVEKLAQETKGERPVPKSKSDVDYGILWDEQRQLFGELVGCVLVCIPYDKLYRSSIQCELEKLIERVDNSDIKDVHFIENIIQVELANIQKHIPPNEKNRHLIKEIIATFYTSIRNNRLKFE